MECRRLEYLPGNLCFFIGPNVQKKVCKLPFFRAGARENFLLASRPRQKRQRARASVTKKVCSFIFDCKRPRCQSDEVTSNNVLAT